jgi:hypothetical protein
MAMLLEEFEKSLERIFYLETNLRLLAARDVYDTVKISIESNQMLEEEKEKILARWMEKELSERLETIVRRSEEIRKIIHDCSETLDGWTLGSELFGISTYYRVEEDGLLSLRMEGVQEIPVFEQLAVLYEVSLFNHWIPFCSQADLLQQICKDSSPIPSSSDSLSSSQHWLKWFGMQRSRHRLLSVIWSSMSTPQTAPSSRGASPSLDDPLIPLYSLKAPQSMSLLSQVSGPVTA